MPNDDLPIGIPLELYLVIAVLLGAVLIAWVVIRDRKAKAARDEYFATFPSGSLRMDPGKIGTVYHVAKKQGAMLTVRVIWTTAGPDLCGITHDFVESDLIPIDPDRFA